MRKIDGIVNHLICTGISIFLIIPNATYAYNPPLIDDPSDCSITVEVPEDLTVCFDEEFNLGGVIIGDYDTYVWLEDGEETGYDLDDDVSINQTTTFTLIAYNENEENIIINGDFEDGDTGFTTDYVVGTTSCFGAGFLDCEGTYGILDDPSDGHTNFSACSDAVGGGNMMVVNGAASLQEIWCQEVCIEPGATYIFSAWAASVNPASPAQLQFSIDGGLIGSLFSLSSSTCDWEEFEAEWSASNETSVEICVTNQNTAAGGNDFALDGIQFIRVCEDEASFTVTHSEFEVEFNNPEELTCIVEEVEIALTITPINDYEIEWETDDGNIVDSYDDGAQIIVNQGGEYFVTVTDMNGCSEEFDIEIDQDIDYPEIEIINSNSINCDMMTSELEVDAVGRGIDFEWYDEEDEFISDDNSVIVDAGGYYYVLAFDPDIGCETWDSIFVDEDFIEPMFNIFSSNNLDCNNDTSILTVDPEQNNVTWSMENVPNVIATTPEVSISTPGLYFASVVLDNGCTAVDSLVIEETNPDFIYNISFDSIINCNHPISQLNLTLDTTAYSFDWISENVVIQDTFNFNIENSGSFLFEITDSLNCQVVDSIIIQEDFLPPLVALHTDSITCSEPFANIGIENPSSEFLISWINSNGEIFNADSINVSQENTFDYTVTAANGCTTIGQVEVENSVSTPSLSITGDTLNCDRLSTVLIPTSNQSDLFYQWLLPNDSLINEQNLTVENPGVYELTATTVDNCLVNASFEVVIDTIKPEFDLPSDYTLDCNNPSFGSTANIISDISNFEFEGDWFDESSGDINIDMPGEYTLKAIAENGCSNSKSFSVDIDTIHPVISFDDIPILDCAMPSFILEANIINDYDSILWLGPGVNSMNKSIEVTSEGTYEITAFASNGCHSSEKVIIESENDGPQFDVTFTTIDCNNPSSIVTIEPITEIYELNHLFLNFTDPIGEVFMTGYTGEFAIEAIGPNGCSTIKYFTLDIDTSTIDFELDAQILTCNNESTQIEIITSEAYTNAVLLDQSNADLGNPSQEIFDSEIYTIELENYNGCISRRSIEIISNKELPVINAFSIEEQQCLSTVVLNDFSISGGEAPYTLYVDNNENDINLNNIVIEGEGDHDILVIDANGCMVDTFITVDPLQEVEAFIEPEITIQEGENAQLNLELNKPLDDITSIKWTPQTDLSCYDCLSPTFTGNTVSQYLVTVNDKEGCSTSVEIRINIDLIVRYFIPNVLLTNTGGDKDRYFTIYDNGIDIETIDQLLIYDRWGNLVFENFDFAPNDPELGWNGLYNDDNVISGVYVYYAVLELRNGEIVKEAGNVTVIE
ncbi:MAG: hypothetical protein HKN51_02345 [Saprospiraceae bacterium]|nr:hypothetical protein [Saprospiraceae bacterium]